MSFINLESQKKLYKKRSENIFKNLPVTIRFAGNSFRLSVTVWPHPLVEGLITFNGLITKENTSVFS